MRPTSASVQAAGVDLAFSCTNGAGLLDFVMTGLGFGGPGGGREGVGAMREHCLRMASGGVVLVLLSLFAGCGTVDVRLSPRVAPVAIAEPPLERLYVVVTPGDPFFVRTAGNGRTFPNYRSYRVHTGEALRRACADAFRSAAVRVVVLGTARDAVAPRPAGPVVRPRITAAAWVESSRGSGFNLKLSMELLDAARKPVAKQEAARWAVEGDLTKAGNRAMAEVVRECAEKLLRDPRVIAMWDYPVR